MIKNSFKILNNRNVLSILIALLIFLIILIFIKVNLLYLLDKKVQNLYFYFNSINVNKDIVVVEIDEETLSGRRNSNGNTTLEGLGRFPFDRRYYAKVIDNLKEAGASIVALDIIFGEKSDDKSDDILSNSIKNAGNVVLGSWPISSGFIQYPYEKFGKYAFNIGFLTPNIDKSTNIVYSINPFYKFRGSDNIVDHFTLAIIKGFYAKIYNDNSFLSNNYKSLPDKLVFSDKIEIIKSRSNQNDFLINYTNRDKFEKKSFLDIYYNQFDKNLFKDKIVIIGATAKGIKDTFNTPLGIEYGVYTHINAINTILTKNGIKYLDTNVELLFIFLLIVISVYFNISKSSYVLIFSNLSLISLFVIFVVYIISGTIYLLNYPVEMGLSFIVSLAISNIVKYYIENKHKTKLNKALSEYVSEDVANEILSGEGKINLNGENKKISIFFSDIQGFTSISEKFSPEDLVAFLREYLTEMSNIILDEKGFINKYEGDAIMALWGVFGNDGKETYSICLAALKQQKQLKELNIEWQKRGFSEIKARIGIHTGNAIIGNIGAEGRKMEFTALGDSVNLASRLEGVNKYYGTFICVSESLYELEKDNFEFRYLDKIRVKGKEIPIKIYELICIKGEITEKQREIRDLFDEGVKLYNNRDFAGAKSIFEKLITLGDNAPRIYIDMCNIYLNTPPPDNWDGVSEMLNK